MSTKNKAIRHEIEKATSFHDGQGNIIKRAGPGFETSADGAIVDDRNVMRFFMHRWLPRLKIMKTRTQVLRQIQDFQEKIPSLDMGILPDGTILPLPANHSIDEQRIHAEIIKVLKNFPGPKTDVTENPGEQVMSLAMVMDAPISVLEEELKECRKLILEAHANERTQLGDLPEKLEENLLHCQKSATRVIQRLNLMVNSPMISSSLSGKQKQEATRVLNMWKDLPQKAKGWADYFNARHEQEWAQMKKVAEEEEVQHEKEWAEMEKEAALQAEQAESDDEDAQKVQGFHPQMKIQKTADFGERIRSATNMTGAVKTNPGGGRKTRKRKRRRKTRKRKKKTKRKKNKKKTKRKHKKRHHRTKRRK